MGFSQNMAAITQHAIGEKRAGGDMFFSFLFPLIHVLAWVAKISNIFMGCLKFLIFILG